jgi:hypothetical protein
MIATYFASIVNTVNGAVDVLTASGNGLTFVNALSEQLPARRKTLAVGSSTMANPC